MGKKILTRKYFLLWSFWGLLLLGAVSCLNDSSTSGRRQADRFSLEKNPAPHSLNSGGAGNSAVGDGGEGVAGVDYLENASPSVKLMHFVDPIEGKYKVKVSLPKNYNGYLYLRGLNISALSGQLLKVRFNFGRELEPVDIPASVGRAEGIIPQTDIQVLIMDLKRRPFENIRMLYDLYDYNHYADSDEPTTDPLNSGLYCRGLRLADDPTFPGPGAIGGLTNCDHTSAECKYSYAKIRDYGPVNSAGVATLPTLPQIDYSGSDFAVLSIPISDAGMSARNENNLKKCLPDNGMVYTRFQGSYVYSTYDSSSTSAALGSPIFTLGTDGVLEDYFYKGPYLAVNKNAWVLRETAAISPTPKALFAGTLNDSKKVEEGINSYLFPRAGKMELKGNVEFIGSKVKPYTTSPRRIVRDGEAQWMDGCNLRVSNFDDISGEGIQSCNVTATVELWGKDPSDGVERLLSSSKEVKLQLTRSSLKDYQGREVLYQSMKSCASSKGCSRDECCFNKRCWSKELVSQCLEDANTTGNYKIGDSCSSDFQCTSLCCDQSKGRCAVHDTVSTPQVFCSKPPGLRCVGSEWCRKESLRVCLVVKTGFTPTGSLTCALRCYNKLQHSDCINGICISPAESEVPEFDPLLPDCTKAVDPPLTLPN